MASSGVNRRGFLQAAVAAAAAAGIGCGRNGTPWQFFTVNEAATLAAVSDHIIPPDKDPGAAWAGVVNYIDRQLCGPLQHLRRAYRIGLAAIDENSRHDYAKSFVDLEGWQQLDLLRRLDAGRAVREAWKEMSSADFFAILVDHTMQGYYGDPRHGGNREGVSWKMLGLDYPPVRGQLRYDLTKT